MTKTKKLFEDFRKFAKNEAGRPHSMRGGRTMGDLDKDAKTRETDFLKKEKAKEKEVDEGGLQHMGHQPNPLEATEEGLNAFWATIAKLNPQITTGDLSPDMDLQTKNIMLAAVEEWIGANTEMASDAVNEEMSDTETQARANLAGAKLNRHGNPRGLEGEIAAIERATAKAAEEERLGNRSVKEKLIDIFKEKIAQLEELVPEEEPTGLDKLASKLAIRESIKNDEGRKTIKLKINSKKKK